MHKDVVDHDAAQTEIKVVSAPKARFFERLTCLIRDVS